MPPTRPPLAASSAPPPRLPTVGEQFDKYSLLAKLAVGGMAELFVARLTGASGFSKTVVIKRILPHVAHDEHFTRMFLDEARTCAQITHPNVCQVFELCEAQGSHFLVLEHLEGATVGDLIRRCVVADQPLNTKLAAGILVQACDGLHAAHELVDEEGESVGLVHRDVSPGNLFVTVDGMVKVLDFGIAKARWMSRKTQTGTLLGKCEYMSPEQARGGVTLDRRSDIFSLGISAWELVCGRRLFRRDSEYDTLRAVLRAPIESPREVRDSIPEALDSAIMRALERDRSDRWRSAYEFRQAIAEAVKDMGGPTPMCDIAPVIRKSFEDELRIQRAVLKQASKIDSNLRKPKLESIPAASDQPPANTAAQTGQRHRLPSLDEEFYEEESNELTFRVIPSKPPASPLDDFVDQAETEDFLEPPSAKSYNESWPTEPDLVRFRRDQNNSEGEGPTKKTPAPIVARARVESAAPETPLVPAALAPSLTEGKEMDPSAISPLAEASIVEAIPRSGRHATHDELNDSWYELDSINKPGQGRSRGTRRAVLTVALAMLLGAAGTTGTLLLLGQDGPREAQSERAPQPAAQVSLEPAGAIEQPSAATPALAPTPAKSFPSTSTGGPSTAMDNDKGQARIIDANAEPAVVTLLGDEGEVATGTLKIHSSQAGTVYLYPDKTVLGTTPLEDVRLPVGNHKLKIQVGPSRGQRKYFHIRIRAGETSDRSFDHWR